MRLFLASSDLGDYKDVFVDLVGDNKKVLIIPNARDHYPEEVKKVIVNEDLGIISDCGLLPEVLDLRPYFGKGDKLREFIDEFKPGCVFSIGGNVYSLATALHLSGMDEILRRDLGEDKYVYAGYSAGAMNASKDLMNYHSSFGKRSGDRLEEAKLIYGEVYTKGLGLIDEYVCPHADTEKYREICKKAEAELRKKGLEPIVLNDADVMVVDGEKRLYKH